MKKSLNLGLKSYVVSKVVRWSRWFVILLENHSRMRELMFGDCSYIFGKYKKGGGSKDADRR